MVSTKLSAGNDWGVGRTHSSVAEAFKDRDYATAFWSTESPKRKLQRMVFRWARWLSLAGLCILFLYRIGHSYL